MTTPEDFRFPGEPMRFGEDELNAMMIWAAARKVSDITFKTGDGVMVKCHGRRYRATKRPLSISEVGEMLNIMFGANGSAEVMSAKDIDTSYEIKPDRDTRLRFRINGTSCANEGHNGIEITARTIESVPPDYRTLGIPEILLEPMRRVHGMNLVTGETGSGKTTLLASMIRMLVEDPEASRKVLTYEWPIEFTYDEVLKPSSIVTQTEIPRHLVSFELGIRNAMRRDPDIILVGESRDMQTMAASIEAARTGHLLMTTLHSNGVASTLRRAVAMFPEGERHGRAIDIIECVNVILTQRLVRSLDGKRVALREYLIFDDEIRDMMLSTPIEKLPALARKLTRERGQTLDMDARAKFNEGLISEREYNSIAMLSKMWDRDSIDGLPGVNFEEAAFRGMNEEDIGRLLGKVVGNVA